MISYKSAFMKKILKQYIYIFLIIFLFLNTGANAISVSNVTNKTTMATTAWILWNVSTEAKNTVEYSTNSDLSDALFSSWDNNTDTPRVKIWNLQPNTSYYYRVWSYNTTNESDYVNSSIYNFTTQECVTYKMVNATDTSITGIDHPIQEAIDSLCPEGGTVELAPGVHDVYEPIVINKSNITIQGTHDSEIRSHDPNEDIFVIPHENPSADEPWDTMPVLENFLFKGFKVTSSYTHEGTSSLVQAWNVKNLTMRDIQDESWIYYFILSTNGKYTTAWNENIYIDNNTIAKGMIFFAFSGNVHVTNNTLIDSVGSYAIDNNRNNDYIYIINNYAHISSPFRAVVIMYASLHQYVYDNIFDGGKFGVYISQSPKHCIVRNNTIRNAAFAGVAIRPQGLITDFIVKNNRIYNCKYGVYTTEHPGAGTIGDVILKNNVIYDNTDDGVYTTTEFLNLTFKNNIIANNGGYGINHGAGVLTTSYNDVWNNANGNYNGVSAGEGDISVDPLFADPDNGDFHLKSQYGRWNGSDWVYDNETSPCIDAGDPSEKDPDGTRINMGAYGGTWEASKSEGSQKRGDLNNNGEIGDTEDLILMWQAYLGIQETDWRYDMNQDGKEASIADVLIMWFIWQIKTDIALFPFIP